MEVFGNNNPVWNENLHFDILKGIDKLKVEVNDVFPDRLNKRELIGMCEIDLASLSEEPNEIDQMKKDKLQRWRIAMHCIPLFRRALDYLTI